MRLVLLWGLFLMAMVAMAAPTKIDINADKVLEEISVTQKIAGNNVWQNVVIKRKGKVIFTRNQICVGIDGYQLRDIDPRFPGLEIVVWLRGEAEGNHFGKANYAAMIWRWNSTEKVYDDYFCYDPLTQFETGDFLALNQRLVDDFPQYLANLDMAGKFCQLIAQAKWDEAEKMLDKDPETGPLTIQEAKAYQKACQQFPSTLMWRIFSSEFDRYYHVYMVHIKNADYTIVVNQNGINKMWLGD